MGSMDFYARDIYPMQGMVDTRTTTVPDSGTQRTLEEDNKAVENVEAVVEGGGKRGVLGTIGVMLIIIVIITFLMY